MRVNQARVPDLQEIDTIKLTPREVDCLAFVVSGRSSKYIALIFSLSVRTIESHIHSHSAMQKLNCSGRQNLITSLESSPIIDKFRSHYAACMKQYIFEKCLREIRKEGVVKYKKCAIPKLGWECQKFCASGFSHNDPLPRKREAVIKKN